MNVALITGCNSGIGLETALRFAREGIKTYATMRNPAKAGDLLDAGSREGLSLEILPLDVTSQDSVDQCVTEVLTKEGRIDVLVNNAGVGGSSPFEITPIEEHHRIFEANYFGTVRMMKAVLPGMRERESGAIVNVASVEGRIAFFNQVAYTSSKWAVEAASEALAYEVARFNIRVAIVEPGVIMTKIFENAEKAGANKFDRNSPYYQVMRRNSKFFKHGFQNPTYPDTVANTIWEATTTDQPKLRWPIGEDAVAMLKGRQSITDEEYIALGLDHDDEEYNVKFKKYFGFELP